MDYGFHLLQKISHSLKTNKVVLLCTSASAWQNEFVASVVGGRNSVDFSNTMIREQALRQPEAFVDKFKERTALYNLEYVLDVLPCLSAADVPNGTFVAVIHQRYRISTMVEDLKGVALIELPLHPIDKEPFLPSSSLVIHPVEYSSGNLYEKILDGKVSADKFVDVESRDKFYAGYLKNFLQRIIKDLTTVSDDMKFHRFLCAVASGTSRMVNYANLGNAADISSPTAKQWLAFLEGTGVVYLLNPIEHGSLKRVAKAPKVYFADTGLAAYLLRINNVDELNESAFFEALFENYVVNAIRDSYISNGFEVNISYFRDSNAKEINLLLSCNNVIYPIDIRRGAFETGKMRKKFRIIKAAEQDRVTKIGVGCVIGLGKRLEPMADDLWYVPVGSLG